MQTAFLLLGSNIGNRLSHFKNAENLIAINIGTITKSSSVYESEPWGFSNQPTFLNKVIRLETLLSSFQLLKALLEIEKTVGRIRTEKWHERIIDIDIIYYDAEIINSEHLKIPHPFLQDRRFTLEPLHEIAPDFIHPIFNKNNRQLLMNCKDPLKVIKIK